MSKPPILPIAALAAVALAAALWVLLSTPRGPSPGAEGVDPLAAGLSPPIAPNPGDRFVDVTQEAGIRFVHRLVDGELTNIIEALGSGAAFVDYDGDGWLDLYFAQSGWYPGVVDGDLPERLPANRLYRNRADGTFEDVTEDAGVADTGFGLAVVAADYDGDGWTDLYVCNAGPNVLYRNLGTGRFQDVTDRAGVGDPRISAGATFFDYDNDGDLDLYVANYLQFDPDYPYFYGPDAYPPPLAYEPQLDVLYRNTGDGGFEDVSDAAGISQFGGRGMSLVASDFDEDGLTDLFVSNDATANFLWHNSGDGTFVESALEFGVAFGENGEATGAMTADTGDFDRDGRLDLFVSDIAYSSLYRNSAKGFFQDHVVASKVALLTGQYVSWGGGFLDFDMDADLDLLVINGDLHYVIGWEDLLLRNDGSGVYSDAADAGAYFLEKLTGRGASIADMDNDGDPDILITNLMDRPVLLRNDSQGDSSWLRLAVKGSGKNPQAYGARVALHLSDRVLVAEVRCPTSYLCSGDPRLLFGLGREDRVERIEVIWPGGERQVIRDVPARQSLEIVRPGT